MTALAVQALLVALGAALTFGGLFVYRRGLMLFGGLVGLGLAFLVTSVLGVAGATQAAVVVTTGVVGAALSQILYVVLLVVPGAVTGFGAAMLVTGTTLTPLSNLLDPVLVVGAVVGAALAVVVRQAVVVTLSASWGPLLVWTGVEMEAIVAALGNVTVPTPPTWVLALVGLGVLGQAGTWALLRDGDLSDWRDSDDGDDGPEARVGETTASDEAALSWEGGDDGGASAETGSRDSTGSDTTAGDD
ncbi:hypothetical protein [Halorientalis litorea]|uniref:hypothetical protein n=1 Tax=Halorientalis litorea TaxID=2931977 RepID=UPI001FF240F4|nr:hypothetical protein [Halorientalis litorea]